MERSGSGVGGERVAFRFRERVRFADLDARGHLNNVAFLALVEAARQAFLKALGVGYEPTRPQVRDLILARNEIDYRAQASWEDEVLVRLWPEDIGDKSFRLRFEMCVGEKTIAEGHSAYVGFDYEQQEPAALEARLKAALEAWGQGPRGTRTVMPERPDSEDLDPADDVPSGLPDDAPEDEPLGPGEHDPDAAPPGEERQPGIPDAGEPPASA